MWLERLKFRIKKYPQGYVVETLITKRYFFFFKKKEWVHIISTSGMSDKPWYYASKEMAMSESVKKFEWDLINGTNNYVDE